MVIDAGHTPADYGAVSCTDHKEVDYNDELVIEISRELAARNIAFLLTRTIGCDTNHDDRLRQYLVDRLDDEKWKRYRELYSRIALANENHAALFISIHHDSVQEHHLSRTEDGKIIDVKDDFKKKFNPGYSIYIACDPRYPDTELNCLKSLKFAEILSKKMLAMGRRPSTYHEEIPGRDNYEPIDLSLGIYNSKTILTVLRNAKMPAVLVEAGVIVDTEDEKVISSQEFKKRFSETVADGIDAFSGR